MRKLYSSVAQLVEQLTVNQLVAGSSPARGAIKKVLTFFMIFKSKNLKVIFMAPRVGLEPTTN